MRNFAILHTVASVVEGHTLVSDAVIRMTAINAPAWVIRGLLSADCSRAEQGTEFGFCARWFGVIAELDSICDPTEEPQGEC